METNKNPIDIKINSATVNVEETITISRAEYETMQLMIKEIAQKLEDQQQKLFEQAQKISNISLQNNWLLEQLKISKRRLYGQQSCRDSREGRW